MTVYYSEVSIIGYDIYNTYMCPLTFDDINKIYKYNKIIESNISIRAVKTSFDIDQRTMLFKYLENYVHMMKKLPYEIINLIFSYVNIRTRLTIAISSKKLRQICYNHNFNFINNIELKQYELEKPKLYEIEINKNTVCIDYFLPIEINEFKKIYSSAKYILINDISSDMYSFYYEEYANNYYYTINRKEFLSNKYD